MTQNKTDRNERGAGASLAIGERERARVQRWRGHIERRIAELTDCPATMPPQWLEEVEGRPLADALVDILVRDRLNGKDHELVALHRMTDEFEEDRGKRARNNYEKDLAHQVVMLCLYRPAAVQDERLHEFVRRFYHAGDYGLHNAVRRAVTCALNWEREADRAEQRPHLGEM